MITCLSAARYHAGRSEAECRHPLHIVLLSRLLVSGDGGRREAEHQAEQHGDHHQEVAGPGQGA